MAKAKSKTAKKVAEAMREVHANPPSTMGTHQTAEERESQMRAIALSKARKAGAKIPKRSSKTSY
jgi:hypothetical protein